MDQTMEKRKYEISMFVRSSIIFCSDMDGSLGGGASSPSASSSSNMSSSSSSSPICLSVINQGPVVQSIVSLTSSIIS